MKGLPFVTLDFIFISPTICTHAISLRKGRFIQFVDAELKRLQGQAAALQTARIAYANALKAALPEAK